MIFLFLFIVIASLFIIPYLKVDLINTNIDSKLTVSFLLSNSSPELMEQQVTTAIEGACSRIAGIKKITSASTYNSGYVELEFSKNENLKLKRFEIAAIIRQIYHSLPNGTSYPIISDEKAKETSGENPVLVYTLSAPVSLKDIKNHAETIFDKAFSDIPAFKEVTIKGADNTRLVIQYDKEKLQQYAIGRNDLENSLKLYLDDNMIGKINESSNLQYFIYLKHSDLSLNLLQNMVIPLSGKKYIRLKDAANVFLETVPPTAFYRINGKNAISLNIYSKREENKLLFSQQVKDVVRKQTTKLPSGYRISLEYNDTDFFQQELTKIYKHLLLCTFILILFVTLVYRNLAYISSLVLGLFVSLSGTVILLFLLNIDVNMYSLAGLTISFGFILDNEIVVMDFFSRFRKRNISAALLAGTSITVSSLLLTFFLPENERKLLVDFSTIVIICLFSSLLVSFYFTPSFFALIGGSQRSRIKNYNMHRRAYRLSPLRYYEAAMSCIFKVRPFLVVLLVFAFGLPVYLMPNSLSNDRWYCNIYNKTLGSDYFVDEVKPGLEIYFGGAQSLFARNVYNRSVYRSPQRTMLLINASLPKGTSSAQLNEILKAYEKYLTGISGLDRFITTIRSAQSGQIQVSFKDESSNLPYILKSALVSRSVDWGGVSWNIVGVGQGFGNANDGVLPNIRVILRGYNYDQLEVQALRLAEKAKMNKRIVNVNLNVDANNEQQKQEFLLNINKYAIALRQAREPTIVLRLSDMGLSESLSSTVKIAEKSYPLIVREKDAEQFSTYNLLNNPIPVDSSRTIYIRGSGTIVKRLAANTINKENRQYIRIVGFDYMGTSEAGSEYMSMVTESFKQTLPVGYSASIDSLNGQGNGLAQKTLLIVSLIFVIYLICCMLFENLKEPLLVIAIIPLSFIGPFLTFSFGQFYFDQGGYAAFFILGGLVANASLLIINDFNRLTKVRPHFSSNKLLIKALSARSKTILLTVISSCCGLLPFILDGEEEVFWYSMGIGVISGLIFSLILLFIVLPAFLWKKETGCASGFAH